MSKPRLDNSREIEKLNALILQMQGDIAELKQSNNELRAASGLDQLPPSIGPEYMMVKQAAPIKGYSESAIWGMIKFNKVIHVWRGGHRLVKLSSIPERGKNDLLVFSDGVKDAS